MRLDKLYHLDHATDPKDVPNCVVVDAFRTDQPYAWLLENIPEGEFDMCYTDAVETSRRGMVSIVTFIDSAELIKFSLVFSELLIDKSTLFPSEF